MVPNGVDRVSLDTGVGDGLRRREPPRVRSTQFRAAL